MAVVVVGDTADAGPSPRRRSALDEGALRAWASRVVVEMETARSLAHLTEEMRPAPRVRLALEEACVIHLAKLRHFFFGSAEDPGTILAADYFPDARAWETIRPKPPVLFSPRWELMTKGLVAFGGSIENIMGDDAGVVCREVAFELIEVFIAFLKALGEERAGWFERLLH